jgi:hypothetical protein
MSWALGCNGSELETTSQVSDAGTVRRDAAPVDLTEAGSPLDAGNGPPPSCAKYCDLVMENCTGGHAQYGSTEECLAFCGHLPLEQPMREAEENEAASVACRQYWADAPARTSPESYCLAAGPFGGNACGDRCTAFCSVVLSACSPDGGTVAYQSQPECASACAGFSYVDAGTDGGGEGPTGPSEGDSLNCRLYWLRAATVDSEKCAALAPQSDVCAR